METYGLTLVEAMACGTPVVAFRVGGIPEAAPDGHGGVLCAPHDGAALVEAVEEVRNSGQLRDMLGERAREAVLVRNRLSSFSSSFAEIYRECVSERENVPREQSAVVT